MDPDQSSRNSWLACPRCGHIVARVRTCDAEFKCKYCGYEFEVMIRPFASGERSPPSPTSSERQASKERH